MDKDIEPLRETADELSRALVFQMGMIKQLDEERNQLSFKSSPWKAAPGKLTNAGATEPS